MMGLKPYKAPPFLLNAFGLTMGEEDTYSWLSNRVELKGGDMDLLKEVTTDKILKTDKPLLEQTGIITKMVNALLVPPGHNNSFVLVGAHGVGKKSQFQILDQKIRRGEIRGLAERRLLSLYGIDPFMEQGKFTEFIDALIRTQGKIMLFIDDIHQLFPSGVDDKISYSPGVARLISLMDSGTVTILGTTTLNDFITSIEPIFQDHLPKIEVLEPPQDMLEDHLEEYRIRYEKEFRIVIDPEVIPEVYRLSQEAFPEQAFPDKAINLLKLVASEASNASDIHNLRMTSLLETLQKVMKRYMLIAEAGEQDRERGINLYKRILALTDQIENAKSNWASQRKGHVTVQSVRNYVTGISNINIYGIDEEDPKKYLHIEEALRKRVEGQDEAVASLSKAIRRYKGLRSPNKPIGVLLFLGLPGVGKTELAKAGTEFWIGNENRIIRIDMTGYGEKHTASNLIGSPRGYKGHEKGGLLTEAVRSRSRSVVLFDELEKADPEVLNLLLPMMDEAYLTDAQGRKIDFRNTIVIMTSNMGVKYVLTEINQLYAQLKETEDADEKEMLTERINGAIQRGVAQAIAEGQLKPEFKSRIKDMVIFKFLTPSDMEKIARIKFEHEVGPLLVDYGFNWKVDREGEVYKVLAKNGYNPMDGARPLNDMIENILDKLNRLFIQAEATGGMVESGTVVFSVKEGRIDFDIQQPDLGKGEGRPKAEGFSLRLVEWMERKISQGDTTEMTLQEIQDILEVRLEQDEKGSANPQKGTTRAAQPGTLGSLDILKRDTLLESMNSSDLVEGRVRYNGDRVGISKEKINSNPYPSDVTVLGYDVTRNKLAEWLNDTVPREKHHKILPLLEKAFGPGPKTMAN